MKSIARVALPLALLWPAPSSAQDEPARPEAKPGIVETNAKPEIVERKKVVVRLAADESGDAYRYVWVAGEDGEPLVLDSFLAARGYLGVQLLGLTPELRHHFGVPGDDGVMISRVEPESPASAAGLETGDILLAIDGESVRSAGQVARVIARGERGDTVSLEVWRDGGVRQLTATLGVEERKQLDLGGLLWGPGEHHAHGRRLPPRGELAAPFVEIDPESMSEALSLMREHFDSPEWREHLEAMGSRRQDLEERIRQLEERLRELEKQLSELPE